MDFDLPEDLVAYLDELDRFIDEEIRPLEEQDDNVRFFDHRREDARTRGVPGHAFGDGLGEDAQAPVLVRDDGVDEPQSRATDHGQSAGCGLHGEVGTRHGGEQEENTKGPRHMLKW